MVSRGILVGVDGSTESKRALDWAAAEAALLDVPLSCYHVAPYGPPVDLRVPLPHDTLMEHGRELTARARRQAEASSPGLAVTEHVVAGSAAGELVAASPRAAMLVLGCRGVGAFHGLLLGSVSIDVAAHVKCPVVVVRGTPAPNGAVLLGVDGSPAGDAAIGFAFDFAARHRLPLLAMHAFLPVPPMPAFGTAGYPDERIYQEASAQLLDEALRPWEQKEPSVSAERLVVHGSAAKSLIDASHGSSLLIVGGRGHGGFTGLLLGSVSQHVLRHADCPVAVVRA